MRKITKLLAFILSMLFVVAVPVGCGSDENIDTTRTQLYV